MKKAHIFFVVFLLLAGASAFSQTITVTAPGPGAVLCQGRSFTITWTASGAMDANVQIRLRQGGGRVLDISDRTANSGSYSWDVPLTVAEGVDYTIRVLTVDEAVADSSDTFSISACSATITVSSPMETGAYMVRGTTPISIAWTSSGITGNVRIDLESWGSAGLYPISASYPYNGSPLSYLVPDGVAAGTYRVKVSQGTVLGYSGRIGILAYVAPGLSVTQPNGGEILTKGGHYSIYWSAHNLDGSFVNIELLYHDRVIQTLARYRNVNSGYLYWTKILSSSLPYKMVLGSGYKIRVSTTDGSFSDDSDGDFSIVALPAH